MEAVLTRFFRLREIREEFAASGARYLDARSWARMTGSTREEAERALELGVEQGHFERMFLYEGHDAPAPFLVPEEYLGKSVKLSTMGFIEDDDREIRVSPYRAREVFVAARG